MGQLNAGCRYITLSQKSSFQKSLPLLGRRSSKNLAVPHS